MSNDLHAVERTRRMSASLRGRYAELSPVVGQRDLRRLLEDLSRQHGRHARELTELLANFAGQAPRPTDGASGDAHLIPPSLPFAIAGSDRILGGIVAAEADMRQAYRIAADSVSADSPLRSTLNRHAVALETILARAEALRCLI